MQGHRSAGHCQPVLPFSNTTSPEKLENAVCPRRNPVMTSSRHCGGSSAWAAKYAMGMPTK